MKNLFAVMLLMFGFGSTVQADTFESQYQNSETSYIRPGPRPAPYPGNPRPYPGPGPGVEYITCESWNYYFQECFFNPYRVHSVQLYNVISYDPCLFNNTYGVNGDRIWVNRGCRAVFEIIRY